MKSYVPLLFALLLSACTSVIHSDGKTVIIEHGTGASKTAVAQAQVECAKTGKSIELDNMKCPMRCVSQFRCVAK